MPNLPDTTRAPADNERHDSACLSPRQRIPLPFPLHPYGCRVEDVPAVPLTDDGWSRRDCLNVNPPPPPGWHSIPHWVVLTGYYRFEDFGAMPEVVSEWIGLPGGVGAGGSATHDGGEQAKAPDLMATEGMAPMAWPAPPRMQEELGIATVLLFPDPVLRMRFKE